MSLEAALAPLYELQLGDGVHPLRLNLGAPPSAAALAAFHTRLPLPLTGSYAELLTRADGVDLFGVALFGVSPPAETDAEAVADLLSRRLVPFHDWGTGDFDCLDLTKVVENEPPVVYWNEEHANIFPIAHGFAAWLPMAVHEIGRFGRLLHPRDYEQEVFANAQGLYESIANVKKTFYGGPEIVERVLTPEAPRRRGLRDWVRARLRR